MDQKTEQRPRQSLSLTLSLSPHGPSSVRKSRGGNALPIDRVMFACSALAGTTYNDPMAIAKARLLPSFFSCFKFSVYLSVLVLSLHDLDVCT